MSRTESRHGRIPVGIRIFALVCAFVSDVFAQTSESLPTYELDPADCRTLEGHLSAILSVAMSRDGKTAATGSNDRNVIFWDTEEGREKLRVRAAGSGITALAFHPDGSLLATGSRDPDVVFWNTDTGKEILRFPGHKATVTALAIDGEGRYLAVGLDNGQAGLWDAKLVKPLFPLNGHSRTITAAAFSSEGRRIAFASQDRAVSVWNVRDGKKHLDFKEHRAAVESLAFDFRGGRVVSGSADRTAIIWNSHDGKILLRLEGHAGPVTFVAFAPDGRTVYTASGDKTFVQWDARTGKPLVRCELEVATTLAAISADAFRTIVAEPGNKASVFRTEAAHFIQPSRPVSEEKGPFAKLPKEVPILRLDPGARPTGSTERENRANGSGPKGNAVAFHPGGPFAVSVGDDSSGVLWNLKRPSAEYDLSYTHPLTAVRFRPDGSLFAIGVRDGSVLFRHPRDGRPLGRVRGHTSQINDLAFSPDGKRLLTAGADRIIGFWDVDSERLLNTFSGHKGSVRAVAITPDMDNAISISDDRTIRIWASSGRAAQVSEELSAIPVSLALAPDGSWFAVGLENKTVTIWDWKEFKTIRTLAGPEQPPVALAVAPDGSVLATGDAAGIAVFWDTKTWVPFRAFPQIPRSIAEKLDREAEERRVRKKWTRDLVGPVPYEPIRMIVFSKDGSQMLSSGGRETFLWDVSKIPLPEESPAEPPENVPKKEAAANPDASFDFSSLPTGKEIRRIEGFQSPVLAAALSRDVSKAVVAEENKRISIINMNDGKESSGWTARTTFAAIRFLPDHRTVLAGGADGRLFSINTATKKDNFASKVHTDAIRVLAVTPGGTRAVTGGSDRLAVVWEIRKGESLGRLDARQGEIRSVAISRDGSKILTGGDNRTAILWDAKTLKQIATFNDHRGAVTAVAFSPDGHRFATVDSKGKLLVYQTVGGKELLRLDGLPGLTVAAEFTSDGDALISASEGGFVLSWDLRERRPGKRFPTRFKPLLELELSVDGKRLLTVDPRGLSLWNVDGNPSGDTP